MASEVAIETVDSFQGEENDIILLSLVRSNARGNVGFLKTNNRINVALSRARNAFYILGNMDMLSKQSDFLKSIKNTLNDKDSLGDGLPIYCPNHPETKMNIVDPDDFEKLFPNGGCHQCQKTNMIKQLPCGHKTADFSFRKPEDIKCLKMVSCKIKDCDHSVEFPCYIANHNCDKDCPLKKDKTHIQELKSLDEYVCSVLEDKVLPCGHVEKNVKCHIDPEEIDCHEPCEAIHDCEHPCPKKCFEPCGLCEVQVKKTVQSCGHKMIVRYMQSITLICSYKNQHYSN